MSRCLSAPDAKSLPTSLPQAAKTKILSVVRIQQKEYLVLCTATSRSRLLVSILLFTKYLTSTHMHTAQQIKGHKKIVCPTKGDSTVCIATKCHECSVAATQFCPINMPLTEVPLFYCYHGITESLSQPLR